MPSIAQLEVGAERRCGSRQPPSAKAQRRVNRWSSRLIPVVLIGLVAYATWVVPVLVGVNYLLNPPPYTHRRRGAGVVILVFYFVFLALMGSAYFRVLQMIFTNPGYVPRPRDIFGEKSRESAKPSEKHGTPPDTPPESDYLDRAAVNQGRVEAPGGLETFWRRDVYECEIDGMPRWCSHCQTWKPDRSHHSSEVNRCVYKMDHFCPWAGGIVGETNYKFFIQFCTYAMFFCAFNLIVLAYFIAQRHRLGGGYNVNWIVILAVCGLFFLFSYGMATNSTFSAARNATSVDNFTRHRRVQHLAILMPDWHPHVQFKRSQQGLPEHHRHSPPPEAMTTYPTITFPLQSAQPPSPSQLRTFAILPVPTGNNPYLLKSPLDNLKTVFGEHWYDWILPLKHSPCFERRAKGISDPERAGSMMESSYRLGDDLHQMKEAAGLIRTGEKFVSTDRLGRRRVSERARSSR